MEGSHHDFHSVLVSLSQEKAYWQTTCIMQDNAQSSEPPCMLRVPCKVGMHAVWMDNKKQAIMELHLLFHSTLCCAQSCIGDAASGPSRMLSPI